MVLKRRYPLNAHPCAPSMRLFIPEVLRDRRNEVLKDRCRNPHYRGMKEGYRYRPGLRRFQRESIWLSQQDQTHYPFCEQRFVSRPISPGGLYSRNPVCKGAIRESGHNSVALPL